MTKAVASAQLRRGREAFTDERASDLPPSMLRSLAFIAQRRGLQLDVSRLMQDNMLANERVDVPTLLHCARKAGLKAKRVKLDWGQLTRLRKALPALIVLKHGVAMVIVGVDADGPAPSVHLQDPNADEGLLLSLDRARLEDVWDGDVILVRRNFDLLDEEQPFSLGFIAATVLKERRLMRDLAVSAMVLSLFALAPILFWRLLSDRVRILRQHEHVHCALLVHGPGYRFRDGVRLSALLHAADHHRARRHAAF